MRTGLLDSQMFWASRRGRSFKPKRSLTRSGNVKDSRNARYRGKPRVRLVTPTTSAAALIAHIRHLQSGWAYESRCGYCQPDVGTATGVRKDATGSVAWYKRARLSGRDRIPLQEYPSNEDINR